MQGDGVKLAAQVGMTYEHRLDEFRRVLTARVQAADHDLARPETLAWIASRAAA